MQPSSWEAGGEEVCVYTHVWTRTLSHAPTPGSGASRTDN